MKSVRIKFKDNTIVEYTKVFEANLRTYYFDIIYFNEKEELKTVSFENHMIKEQEIL